MNGTAEEIGNFGGYITSINVILFVIVCFVGLVGNTLVIYVVIRFSKMQTVTNMYIVNLAIADECFLIGLPFLIVTTIKKYWIFGHIACKAYMISTSINQFTSSIFLCVMSADRYIAVCHPISSPRWRTPFISKLVSLFAWITSILLIIPIIQHAKTVPKNGDQMSCVIYMDEFFNSSDFESAIPLTNESYEGFNSSQTDSIPKEIIFTRYTFVFAFAVPLFLILIFYFNVVRKLKNVGPKNKSKEKKRSHRKVTNLVLTVVAVYVVCWLPYWILQLAGSNREPNSFLITVHLLISCLTYSNSAINPILYAFLSDNFKKSFLKACTCAAKDVNAQLHLENSVFPRKNKHNSERGPLVNKRDPSTSITMTSRTTNTTSVASRERHTTKNGVVISQPTSL